MKAKRYEITVYDGMLAISHGFGQTIKEIRFDDGLTINSQAIFKSDKSRIKDIQNLEDVEVDNQLYDIFVRYESIKNIAMEEAKRIVNLKTTEIKATSQTPIFSWDDFERRYLPKRREERLREEETPEQTGERLAKESLEKIKEDLHKHKRARRKK